MCKPIYEEVQSHIEPHRWQERDTPALNELLHHGDDTDNIYGKVILQKGELRIRVSDDLYSVWVGQRLEATIKDRELAETMISNL
jgi:hypothetical protein